ncbi:hypothetical protein BpHYR1_019674 [Brachionus plicatilis]|uniref:Uncharacterized protein n=1 Tax=Brachionus plicatilis TaxID=10195 RepID=A0A3M7P5Q5_BRAPC|nr:hypothetical protein BpHYR1_019674 [Brachionus plicatilis]
MISKIIWTLKSNNLVCVYKLELIMIYCLRNKRNLKKSRLIIFFLCIEVNFIDIKLYNCLNSELFKRNKSLKKVKKKQKKSRKVNSILILHLCYLKTLIN